MSNPLIQQLLKNSKYPNQTSLFADSKLFKDRFSIPTRIPAFNIALSGNMDEGLTAGLTILAGESKSFKTLFGLILAKTYMNQYPDSVMLFYDTEFGSLPPYFEATGIDTSRVIHTFVHNVEEMKFDMVNQLDNLKRGQKVFVFVDSIGNVASKKELEDAINMNSAADMSRAKALKSLFRIVTPYFSTLDIPAVMINHTYKSQGLFAQDIVSGGSGAIYSANNIFIITKSQEKTGKNIIGWNFTLNVAKSRTVKEKSKIPVQVIYDKGVNLYSGLLDLALEFGYVTKPSQGWYTRMIADKETGEILEDKKWRATDTDCAEFWDEIYEKTDFKEAIKRRFKLSEGTQLINEDSKESSNNDNTGENNE